MSFEGGAGLRRIKTASEFALLKLDFKSEIYARAVDLKRYPCLPRRFIFASHCLCIAATKSCNFAGI